MTVRVVVNRDGLAATSADFPWAVGDSPDQARPAVVSTAPIGSVLRAVAGALLVLAGLTWWFALRGRARRHRGRPTQAEISPDDRCVGGAATRVLDEAVKDHAGATS
jgi:hypothetical protein